MAASYGPISRGLHHFAFCHPEVQRSLARVEDDFLHKGKITAEVVSPVFITGLARAGTTLTLNLLYGGGAYASLTYRDMPFPLAPGLWRRISGERRATDLKERMHKDGLLIGAETPEAFDEIVWLNVFGERILGDDHIRVLDAEEVSGADAKAIRFAAARVVANCGNKRYLSKNNALLSRLPALRRVFPDAIVVVVVRDPIEHVSSLARQHKRFLEIHAQDKFTRRYMRWLGHHEFGADYLPLGLGGLRRPRAASGPDENFFLETWIAAYEAAAASDVVILDYSKLCVSGGDSLRRLAEATDTPATEAYLAQASALRPPPSAPKPFGIDTRLMEKAYDLHSDLIKKAL